MVFNGVEHKYLQARTSLVGLARPVRPLPQRLQSTSNLMTAAAPSPMPILSAWSHTHTLNHSNAGAIALRPGVPGKQFSAKATAKPFAAD